jgi:hypothetical protein
MRSYDELWQYENKIVRDELRVRDLDSRGAA